MQARFTTGLELVVNWQ